MLIKPCMHMLRTTSSLPRGDMHITDPVQDGAPSRSSCTQHWAPMDNRPLTCGSASHTQAFQAALLHEDRLARAAPMAWLTSYPRHHCYPRCSARGGGSHCCLSRPFAAVAEAEQFPWMATRACQWFRHAWRGN